MVKQALNIWPPNSLNVQRPLPYNLLMCIPAEALKILQCSFGRQYSVPVLKACLLGSSFVFIMSGVNSELTNLTNQ